MELKATATPIRPRIEELDFLRGIFILLVVAFHLVFIGDSYPLAKQFVYTFHMPGFLIISGYLFNPNKSARRTGTSLLWIFIPYLVMEVGYTAMAAVLPIREHIDHLSPAVFLDKIFIHPLGPYWYLHTLLLCGLNYYLVFRIPKLSLITRWILLAISYFALARYAHLLVFANALYFMAGAMLRQSFNGFRFSRLSTWWAAIPLILLATHNNNFDRASLPGITIVILVFCFLLWTYRLPTKHIKSTLLFIGRNTMPIYLFSPIFTILAKIYQPFLINIDSSGMLFLVISIAFAVCGSILITLIMDKLHLSRLFFGKAKQLQ